MIPEFFHIFLLSNLLGILKEKRLKYKVFKTRKMVLFLLWNRQKWVVLHWCGSALLHKDISSLGSFIFLLWCFLPLFLLCGWSWLLFHIHVPVQVVFLNKKFFKKINFAVLALSCGMWDLVRWLGIQPGPPPLGVWSRNHWTTREVPTWFFSLRRWTRGCARGLGSQLTVTQPHSVAREVVSGDCQAATIPAKTHEV